MSHQISISASTTSATYFFTWLKAFILSVLILAIWQSGHAQTPTETYSQNQITLSLSYSDIQQTTLSLEQSVQIYDQLQLQHSVSTNSNTDNTSLKALIYLDSQAKDRTSSPLSALYLDLESLPNLVNAKWLAVTTNPGQASGWVYNYNELKQSDGYLPFLKATTLLLELSFAGEIPPNIDTFNHLKVIAVAEQQKSTSSFRLIQIASFPDSHSILTNDCDANLIELPQLYQYIFTASHCLFSFDHFAKHDVFLINQTNPQKLTSRKIDFPQLIDKDEYIAKIAISTTAQSNHAIALSSHRLHPGTQVYVRNEQGEKQYFFAQCENQKNDCELYQLRPENQSTSQLRAGQIIFSVLNHGAIGIIYSHTNKLPLAIRLPEYTPPFRLQAQLLSANTYRLDFLVNDTTDAQKNYQVYLKDATEQFHLLTQTAKTSYTGTFTADGNSLIFYAVAQHTVAGLPAIIALTSNLVTIHPISPITLNIKQNNKADSHLDINWQGGSGAAQFVLQLNNQRISTFPSELRQHSFTYVKYKKFPSDYYLLADQAIDQTSELVMQIKAINPYMTITSNPQTISLQLLPPQVVIDKFTADRDNSDNLQLSWKLSHPMPFATAILQDQHKQELARFPATFSTYQLQDAKHLTALQLIILDRHNQEVAKAKKLITPTQDLPGLLIAQIPGLPNALVIDWHKMNSALLAQRFILRHDEHSIYLNGKQTRHTLIVPAGKSVQLQVFGEYVFDNLGLSAQMQSEVITAVALADATLEYHLHTINSTTTAYASWPPVSGASSYTLYGSDQQGKIILQKKISAQPLNQHQVAFHTATHNSSKLHKLQLYAYNQNGYTDSNQLALQYDATTKNLLSISQSPNILPATNLRNKITDLIPAIYQDAAGNLKLYIAWQHQVNQLTDYYQINISNKNQSAQLFPYPIYATSDKQFITLPYDKNVEIDQIEVQAIDKAGVVQASLQATEVGLLLQKPERAQIMLSPDSNLKISFSELIATDLFYDVNIIGAPSNHSWQFPATISHQHKLTDLHLLAGQEYTIVITAYYNSPSFFEPITVDNYQLTLRIPPANERPNLNQLLFKHQDNENFIVTWHPQINSSYKLIIREINTNNILHIINDYQVNHQGNAFIRFTLQPKEFIAELIQNSWHYDKTYRRQNIQKLLSRYVHRTIQAN